MMTPRERIETFWAGEKPDRIPLSIYRWFKDGSAEDPAWQNLAEKGLVFAHHIGVFKAEQKDAEFSQKQSEESGHSVMHEVMKTSVGEVSSKLLGGWRQEYWLKTAEDYRVWTHIVKNTDISPDYEPFIEADKKMGPNDVPMVLAMRSPIQSILVDLVGLENFALHLFDLEEEMMELYDALAVNFKKQMEIIAEGPGRYVALMENFTAETMGPRRYEQFHLPIYNATFPMLHDAGKIIGTHYDGKLAACKELVANSPIDLLESFTPPPEGDMTFDVARAALPDKLFWSNINVSNYELPPEKLREVVTNLVQQAAPDGRRLAFEVSEELPHNWRESVAVVLDTLADIAG